MSRILPLPPDAVAQIHSSKNITSLQGVGLALLENCLDASATKVDILVDFSRGSCVLEDNGLGIPPAEFTKEGGLGRMYHTSKHSSGGEILHGRTGTYLAQVAALSLLNITSRHHHGDEDTSLTLHQGKVIARNFPAPSGHELFHEAHGTRVTVRDLFGNMPVRVKQRALAGATSNDEEKAWNELKRGVVALLLAWPRPCAVKLRNAEKSDKNINLHSSHPTVSAALTERSIRQLSGKALEYDVRDALPLVFQAGLAPYESRAQWIAISTTAGTITVKGLICLNPAPTKLCQFISIGIHPCSRLGGHNELYEAVNKTFSSSSFGAVNDTPDLDEAEKERRLRDQRYKNDGYTQKQLHGRKGVDRHPMFVLQVKLSDGQHHHVTAESPSESHLKNIIDVLEATATQWLAANHFRPRKRRQKTNQAQMSAARMSSLRPFSAVPTSTGSALAEDNLKRPATLASTMSLKKRRLDPPGRVATPVEPALESASSYFNGLSRIKSGSAKESTRIENASTAQGSKAVEMGRPAPSVFKLPSLEAGQLNSAATMQSLQRDEISRSPRSKGREDTPPAAAASSDKFGSIPDDELLTAVESTQSHGSPAAGGMYYNAGNSTNDEVVDWTDPLSKESFKVNARTGVVLPSRTKTATGVDSSSNQHAALPRTPAAIDTSTTSAGKAVSLSRRAVTAGTASGHSWLPGFLKDWDNPVFAKQDEEPIPVASFDGPGIDAAELGNRQCTHNSMTPGLSGNVFGCTAKLSKEALKDVQIIRQVDNKFILCKMPSSQADGKGASTLVLVDQHAASERVILENLLQELCAPIDAAFRSIMSEHFGSHTPAVKTVLLERPQRFQIGAQEADLFTRHMPHFARWGIMYHLSPSNQTPRAPTIDNPSPRTEEEGQRLIIVRALPPSIAERCTLFPNLLIEMLRSEIWRRADSPSSAERAPAPLPPPQSDPETFSDHHDHHHDEVHDPPPLPHEWLKHLHTCPTPLLDLLNSRACRSAIMFNDVLTPQECAELMGQLSR
ncbi:hypothetical protein KC318_g11823, partial [Hortaea werneckii]